jgi:hypothetical protein
MTTPGLATRCAVCGAPATRTVGLTPACDGCAEPLRQAAIGKRDAVLAALRDLARTPDRIEEQEDAA